MGGLQRRTWLKERVLDLLAFVVVLAAVVLLASASGCTAAKERDQAIQVVREGRVLLRRPLPGDPEWEVRRLTFLTDAEAVAPSATANAVATRSP